MCAAGFPGRLNMRTDAGGRMLPGNTSKGKWRGSRQRDDTDFELSELLPLGTADT